MRTPITTALVAFVLAIPRSEAGPVDDWTGSMRCELQASAAGYSHHEVQTWTIAGGVPTTQGAFTIYPATWSVTGQGTHDRERNNVRRLARWDASATVSNAPISFHVTPAGQLVAQLWHSQLTAQGGYTGTDQYFDSGVPRAEGRLVATAYEWQPARIAGSTSDTGLAGSTTTQVGSQVGPLQPPEARATVACSWSFGQGSAPALPPSGTAPPAGAATGTPSSAGGSVPPPVGATTPPATASQPPAGTSTPPATSMPPSHTTPPPDISAPPPASAAPPPDASPPSGAVIAPPGSSSPPPAASTSPGSSTNPTGAPLRPGPSGLSPATAPRGTGVIAPRGGLTADPSSVPRDPENFLAAQVAEGAVRLSWNPVPGVSSYVVLGPGAEDGLKVDMPNALVTGIPLGTHEWRVTSWYAPGGSRTVADRWPRASLTVKLSPDANGKDWRHATNLVPGRPDNPWGRNTAVTITGRLHERETADWFKLDVASRAIAGTKVTITLMGVQAPSEFDVSLYNIAVPDSAQPIHVVTTATGSSKVIVLQARDSGPGAYAGKPWTYARSGGAESAVPEGPLGYSFAVKVSARNWSVEKPTFALAIRVE